MYTSFQEADLTKLQYLNLSENAISEIGLNAFDGIPDLAVLDLSKNRLYYVLNEIFRGHKKLRILKLSKNNFNSHVPKLRSSSITVVSQIIQSLYAFLPIIHF